MTDSREERQAESVRVWEYMLKQHESAVSQFATALVGEGALLFAFGQIAGIETFVRLTIAFLGLGSGILLWMHSFTSRQNAIRAQEVLRRTGSETMAAYDAITAPWRERRWFKPITRVMVYANGLISFMWFTILLYVSAEQPWGVRSWPAWLDLHGEVELLVIADIVVFGCSLLYLAITSDDGSYRAWRDRRTP